MLVSPVGEVTYYIMTDFGQGNSRTPERLSKIMAARGLCSRREADELIEKGFVLVDGQVAQLGMKVLPDVNIEILAMGQKKIDEKVTILLHKPVGYVSGQPEPGHTPAVRLISLENQAQVERRKLLPKHIDGLAPAGRLDVDSSGLLVFTQDGRVAKQLIGEESDVEKEYLVRITGDVTPEKIKKLCFGLQLDGRQLRRADVSVLNEDQLKFILKEGRKRQIRRMCEMVDLRVTGLKRVRIGRVRLSDLPLGQWRFLSPSETF